MSYLEKRYPPCVFACCVFEGCSRVPLSPFLLPVNPTQVKLAGSHHVLANLWPPSNLPMSSPPQWEASFSSQTFSANPQSLLPASPRKDLQPVTQQGWSCSRCGRDGGDRAGDAGLGVASRLEPCKETKMLSAPTPSPPRAIFHPGS